MTTKYTTDYWQSLELLQAGLRRDTADYMFLFEDPNSDVVPCDIPTLRAFIPSWSFCKLWEIIKAHGLSYEFSTDMEPNEVIRILIEAVKNNEIEA